MMPDSLNKFQKLHKKLQREDKKKMKKTNTIDEDEIKKKVSEQVFMDAVFKKVKKPKIGKKKKDEQEKKELSPEKENILDKIGSVKS